jgi:hypothetical protein
MSLRSRRRLAACSFSMLTLLLCSTPPASSEFEPLHCLACGVGFFRDQPTKTCSACPQGSSTFTYSNASSPLHCLCKPGFENASQACELCASDFFKGGLENRSCTPCTANAFGAAGAVSHLNCTCKAGFEPYDNVCNLCPTGKYKNQPTNIGFANELFVASQSINLARAYRAGGCPVNNNLNYPGWEPAYYPPMFVNDGDLNTFHHTAGAPTWTIIDLEKTVFVTRIRLYNRVAPDCCGNKLKNFNLRLGDSPNYLNNPACALDQANFVDFRDFTCILSGRYFSIDMPLQYLHLREIEIYGTKILSNTSLYKCQVCPVNTATNNTGTVVCEACDAGKTTDGRTGHVECVCDVGTEPGVNGDCETCRAGRFKATSTDKYANRACVNCSSCGAGQQVATECNSTHNVTCRACQARHTYTHSHTLSHTHSHTLSHAHTQALSPSLSREM